MDTTAHASAPREVTGEQLTWLRAEVADWRVAGIIGDDQAAAIEARYTVADGSTSSVLGRVLLVLGGGFVGVGLIWLVAANLDQMSPLARFLTVAALWLGFLVGGEVLDARRTTPALVGAIRLLAALAFGAVIMQAAQSLQVPAYSPVLVGLWSLGAMVHGHLTRATTPFLVGLATGIAWWIWQPLWHEASGLTVVFSLGAAAVVAASLAVLTQRWAAPFARSWRLTAAALSLAVLFTAAIPGIHGTQVGWTWLVVEILAALGLAAVAMVLGVRGAALSWAEPVGALVVAGASVLLAVWDTGTDVTDVGADQWAHGALSVIAYVALAVALVALAVIRGQSALTWLAMGALVLFTTVQSFAVFAPIVTGAWLFVVLGVVFLGTGVLFDRTRRRVARALSTDDPTNEGADR